MADRRIIASFKIEKGIPVPPKEGGRRAIVPYPFLELEVGDSFWSASKRSPPITGHNAILARNQGRKFTSRREDRGDQKGFRIWRIL